MTRDECKPGPGWDTSFPTPVYDHVSGLRVHAMGILRLPSGEIINGGPVATFCSETRVANDIRDGLACVGKMLAEIRRLRSELASERATHQELWQMVDRELDRIYCEQKGIDQ